MSLMQIITLVGTYTFFYWFSGITKKDKTEKRCMRNTFSISVAFITIGLFIYEASTK